MNKPQKITLANVKEAAREYYKARHLTAQHRVADKRICMYGSGVYRCAIGAAFTKKTMNAVIDASENYGTAVLELDPNIVQVRSDKIDAIQQAHDDWCDAARLNKNSAASKEYEAKFKRLIAA